MHEITLPVTWSSNEFADHPELVKLSFTDADVARIKTLQAVAVEHNVEIQMPFTSVSFFMEDPEEEKVAGEETDFTPSVERILIWADGELCFKCFDDNDDSVAINSDFFSLEDLLTPTY